MISAAGSGKERALDFLESSNVSDKPVSYSASQKSGKGSEGAESFNQVIGSGSGTKGRDLKSGSQRTLGGEVNAPRSTPSRSESVPGPLNDAKTATSSVKGDGAEKSNASENAIPEQQRPMLEFLSLMQEHLGVEPQEIISAMANLSPEELERSPEETSNLVLNQLQLSMEQRQLADVFYQRMLQQTSPQVTSAPSMEMKVVSQRDLSRKSLETGLQKLNNNFFTAATGNPSPAAAPTMPPSGAPSSNSPTTADARALQQNAQSPRPNGRSSGTPIAQEAQTAVSQNSMEFTEPLSPMQTTEARGPNSDLAIQRGSARSGEAVPPGVTRGMSEGQAAPQGIRGQIPNPAGQMQSLTQAGTAFFSASDVTSPAPESERSVMTSMADQGSQLRLSEDMPMAGIQPRSQNQGEMEDKDSSGESSQEMGTGHLGHERSTALNKEGFQQEVSKLDGTKPDLMIANSSNTTTERVANMTTIMERARFLAQGGGGEARIQLNPQNLGQVDLKVVLNDGRVSVEMITESEQAKKMLEGGVRELQSDLNSSNMSLDKLKVDVGRDVSSDLSGGADSQGQNSETAQDVIRDFSRGFMGQQRDERLWQREQSLLDPGFRNPAQSYVRNRIEDGAEAQRKPEKNRRLDVIA